MCCLRRALQPSATETSSFRSDTSTSGSADSPTACMILCVRFVWVVRQCVYPSQSRNTQYGWVVSPYPTGTLTLQDAPSFAWRANAAVKWAAKERSGFADPSSTACSDFLHHSPFIASFRIQSGRSELSAIARQYLLCFIAARVSTAARRIRSGLSVLFASL